MLRAMAKRAAAAEAGAARRVRPRAASAKAASPPVAPSAAAAATATTAAAPTAAGRTGAPAARPTRSADGSLAFVDFPVFRPRLTPEEVIRAGSFGGCYFHPRGGKPGILSPAGVAVSPSDHPAAWFASLPVARFANRRYDCAVNKYGVTAGTDQARRRRSAGQLLCSVFAPHTATGRLRGSAVAGSSPRTRAAGFRRVSRPLPLDPALCVRRLVVVV